MPWPPSELTFDPSPSTNADSPDCIEFLPCVSLSWLVELLFLLMGLADVLFPVTPPPPKEARLVLGRAGLRCSVTEQWHSQRESATVHIHPPELSTTTAVATLAVDSESVPSHKLAYKSRRRGDRATRNLSLLAAAGLDKSLESTPASAGL